MRQGTCILGISRAMHYSPCHVDHDEAIFMDVARNLTEAGFRVTRLTEGVDRIPDTGSLHEDLAAVFSMARSEEWLDFMDRIARERHVTAVVNSAQAVRNCGRERMAIRLSIQGIPCPESLVLDTRNGGAGQLPGFSGPYWVKRADGQTLVREDVSFVRDAQELSQRLEDLSLRGVDRAVVCRHLKGDLVKFYALSDGSFFRWFYPQELKHSKFGHEVHNGPVRRIAFSQEAFRATCTGAGKALGAEVFGGDAIIGEDHVARLIDLNDWPSFAPCRQEAAQAIARMIIKKTETP